MTVRRLPDTLWRKRLKALERVWAAARDGDPKGVHRLRVATRRIREALPLVSDGQRPRRVKKLRRKIRALTRTLGPVRERDVSLTLLSALEERHPENQPAIGLVRQLAAAELKDFRAELEKHLVAVTPEQLVKKLTKAARRPKPKSPEPDRHDIGRGGGSAEGRWQLVLAARIARRAKQLQEAVEYAGALYAPDRLHVVRVTVKKLRYALEVGHEARLARWRSALRSLQQTQDILGQLWDRETLLERVRAAHTSQGSPAVSEAFDRLTRLLEEETRQYHAEFVRRRPRLLKVCATARQQASQALPLGRPAPKRLADISPSAAADPAAARRAARR